MRPVDGTANPAVTIQATLLRLAPGTIVVILGKVMRVSPIRLCTAPTPAPTKGSREPPPQPGQVDIGRQPSGQGRQIHHSRLPPSGLQETGAALEREPRTVFGQHLQPHHRRGGVAQPDFNNGHHSEIADRAVRRAIAAPGAAVERRRGNA